MLIPRLASAHNSTPIQLYDLYIRRLNRRGGTAKGTARVITMIRDEMQIHTRGFAESLKLLVPREEYAIIVAGEESSDIPTALSNLMKLRERSDKINRANRKAFGTIATYYFLILATFWAVAKFSLPTLEPFARSRAQSPSTSQSFILTGAHWATGYGPILMTMIVIALLALIRLSFSRLTGPVRMRLEKFPPWSTYRATQGFIWLSTFLILVRSGQSETKVLRNQIEMAHPWLKERLVRIEELMTVHALLLPAALDACGFQFPSPDMIDEIANDWGGAEAGYDRMSESNELAADESEAAALRRAAIISATGTIIMWLLTGALTLASYTFISPHAN